MTRREAAKVALAAALFAVLLLLVAQVAYRLGYWAGTN